MEMPKPTEEHRKLPKIRVDLDGFFVVQDYVEEKDGRTADTPTASRAIAITSASRTRSTAARRSP